MPTDLIHRAGEKIYRALATAEGIKDWWTTDVKMDQQAGGKAKAGGNPAAIIAITATPPRDIFLSA